jgi:OOP family OmpA-OmpF porin
VAPDIPWNLKKILLWEIRLTQPLGSVKFSRSFGCPVVFPNNNANMAVSYGHQRKEGGMMKKSMLIALMLSAVVFSGWAATKVQAVEIITEDDIIKGIIVTEHLIKTADNAIILFDSSDSMSKKFLDTGKSRYEIAKEALLKRNAYFPDLGYNFGLYLYSPWKAVYPVQPYNRDGLAAALNSLPEQPKGPTMLQGGLRQLESVLKNLTGRTVVFVITDGTYMDVGGTRPGEPTKGKRPGAIAKDLAKKYDVCFCVISTADDKASRQVIENVASVSPCSIGIPFARFINRPEYNSGMLYVVSSTVDVVTITEKRVVGAKVDNILFDYDVFDIPSRFHDDLDKLGRFMKDHPDTYALLAGFSCNQGGQAYNLGLSKFRVRKVAQYLENKFNIDADRLVTLWYGQLNPVGDNNTKEGRRLNRRVEIAVGGL